MLTDKQSLQIPVQIGKTIAEVKEYFNASLSLLGYLFDRLNRNGSLAHPVIWLGVIALLYGGLCVGIFLWAMAGWPLLRLA